MKKKKKNEKSKIWLVLFFICLIVAVFTAGMLFKQYIDRQEANDGFSDLQKEINGAEDQNGRENGMIPEKDIENGGEEENTEREPDGGIVEENRESGSREEIEETGPPPELDIEIPRKELDWDELREKNPDIYAWIYVPDTTVDYPVLQHPTDNTYYLDHNMDGTKGYPGCIYTEDFNSRDFSDIHTVIYGHNLKDKTMFSTLHNFEDAELFQEDHYIFIYTEEDVFVYQIFAAYEFGSIHLLDNYDYTNEYIYEDYLRQIYQATDGVSNIRRDIEVTAKDKIVTLSTCTADHDSGWRFLVTGVLLNPKEQGR